MKKKILAILLVIAMVLGMTACGASSAPAAEAPAAPEAPAVEPVTLNVAYMPNWGSLWAVATADAMGFFAEEGITVQMTAFEDGPTEIAAMESGAMDVAFIGPGAHKLSAKGQANVETLLDTGHGYNVYYAFLVKCPRFVERFKKPMLTPMLVKERA